MWRDIVIGDGFDDKLFNMQTNDFLQQVNSRPISISSDILTPHKPTYAIKSTPDELIKIQKQLEIANQKNDELW